MSSLDDLGRLLLEMEGGCAVAERKFFSGLRDVSYRFAVSRLTRDEELANDLAQEACFRLFKAYFSDCSLRDAGKVESLVITTTKNLYINLYRRKGRSPLVPMEAVDDGMYAFVNEGSFPPCDQGLVRDDLYMVVCEGVPHVDEWRMARLEGYRYEELAELFGVPIGTVKSRIHFASRRMRERCREQGLYVSGDG